MGTEFGTDVSNRMLLNAVKFRVKGFTVLELLRKNQLGWDKILPLHPEGIYSLANIKS